MAKAKAKGKAKRYTDEKKKEILDFIIAQGRGGQTKAVKKYKVTAATIVAWKKKVDGASAPATFKGGSKELKTVRELEKLLNEIASTEVKLDDLRKRYKQVKAKL
ncbi:hypothetical protein GYB43_01290 [bacterium]|jgi:transposase|nr:hypothetical protein [bacterium]